MYLFIDEKRITDFKKYESVLKEIFPTSYTDNPQPVIIKQVRGKMMAQVFKKGDLGTPVRSREIKSPPTKIATNGTYNENGVAHEWRLCDTLPTSNKENGKLMWGSRASVTIEDGTPIDIQSDIAKFVALWFFSRNFGNNAMAVKNAKYEFVIPSQESKKRIEKVTFASRIANELLNNGSAMSYDKVKSIYGQLGLNVSGVEEDDRLQLHDLVLQNTNGFNERYERAKANLDALSRPNGASDMVKVTELVNKAKKAKVLVEVGGFWIAQNENGAEVRKITEVQGDKATDKQLFLVEYFNQAPEDVDLIESLLAK